MSRSALWLIVFSLFFPLSPPADCRAANDRTDPPPALPNPDAPGGRNPSGMKPPEASDSVFVVNEGPALDGPLRFSSDGDLVINIPVTRYAFPTTNDGQLSSVTELIKQGYVHAYAELIICAYDVDCDDDACPERNTVKLNGELLRHNGRDRLLQGQNGKWMATTYKVQIGQVRFPREPGGENAAPTPRDNELRISIDVDSAPPGSWGTAIDWVALKIGVLSPVIMVHGTGSSNHIFDPSPPTRAPQDLRDELTDSAGQGWTTFAAGAGPHRVKPTMSLDVLLHPPDFRRANGKKLAQQIPAIAQRYGVDSVHIVAHSKGGLDVRDYLQFHHDFKSLQIVSFTTLSTPHDGSILADLIAAGKASGKGTVRLEGFDSNLSYAYNNAQYNKSYSSLTTADVAAFNRDNVKFLRQKFPDVAQHVLGTIGADLDANLNGGLLDAPDDGEWLELRHESKSLTNNFNGWLSGSTTRKAVHATYRTLGTAASISCKQVNTSDGSTVRVISVATSHDTFRENDVLVTVDSAHGKGGGYWDLPGRSATYRSTSAKNHSSVCGRVVAERVLRGVESSNVNDTGWIVRAEQLIGDLK